MAATVVEDLASAAPRLCPGPRDDLRDAEAELLEVERAAQEAIRQWDSTGDDQSLRALRTLVTDGALDKALADFRSAVRPGRQAVPAVAEAVGQLGLLTAEARGVLTDSEPVERSSPQ